jgi:hypothetical protein
VRTPLTDQLTAPTSLDDDWEQDYDDADVAPIEEEEEEVFGQILEDVDSLESHSEEESAKERRTSSSSKGKSAQRSSRFAKEDVPGYDWQVVQWSVKDKQGLDIHILSPNSGETFRARLHHSITVRKRQAMSFDWSDLRGCHFTKGMLSIWQHLQPDVFLDWILSNMGLEVLGTCGQNIRSGNEYLALPGSSNVELMKWGIYLFLILDKDGNVLFAYIGSGTGYLGVFGRCLDYDLLLEKSQRLGHIDGKQFFYISEALKAGGNVQIRPLFLISSLQCSGPRMLAVEGIFTDVFNTLDVTEPSRSPWRTQESLDAYTEAVPEDMRAVEYEPANRAHQFTQGSRSKSPPCCMIGKGCPGTSDSKKSRVMFMENGELAYGCSSCSTSWKNWTVTRGAAADSVASWKQFKLRQTITEEGLTMPHDATCSTCDHTRLLGLEDLENPPWTRLQLGDVGFEYVCVTHESYWRKNGFSDQLALLDPADMEACSDLFVEFLDFRVQNFKAKIEKQNQEVEVVQCLLCEEEYERRDMMTLHHRLKAELKPSFDSSCKFCYGVWHVNEQKPSKSKISSFEPFKAECIRKKDERILRDDAAEARNGVVCPCGDSSSSKGAPPNFQYTAQYSTFCKSCYAWVLKEVKANVTWTSAKEFVNTLTGRSRRQR